MSTSRRLLRGAAPGVALLVCGMLLTTGPASAQESREAAERRLAELRARQELELRAQRSLAEAELTARHAEREAMEKALGAAHGALRAGQAAGRRLQVVGPGGAFSYTRHGLSAETVLARAEELELDDTQIERIRAAHREHRRAEIERDAAIEVTELDLDELLEADTVDLQAVEAKMMDAAALRVRARVADLRLRQEVESVLTAEQRERLDDMGHGYLFKTTGVGPDRVLFRGSPGQSWGRLREDVERGIHEGLEPLRELRWLQRDMRRDCPCDKEGDEQQEGEEQERAEQLR